MPLQQTITIVNNSGKIISTGKQLFSIYKEAKASYDEKKAEVRNLKRAETFDQSRSAHSHDDQPRARSHRGHHHEQPYEPDYITEYDYGRNPDYHGSQRRRSFDAQSHASSRRSHYSKASHSRPSHNHARSRPALTEKNLKTHSEVSSTAPSRAPPMAYHSPYAETLTKDMTQSQLDLRYNDRRSVAETEWRRDPLLSRTRSESEIVRRDTAKPGKEIDMNLAYGNIPPDLEFRTDLDPVRADEQQANQLVRKVEGLLTEAECLRHSATGIIKHLQEKPDAAAAVALTLAELSSVVGKISPAFLGLLKGGSPSVFALLASPQFLIGTGAAVGLTVVMFGGWKIVKSMKEAHAAREALAYEGVPRNRPAPLRTQSEYGAGMDEALVYDLDQELSSIETWRRGIMPAGADDESAEIELITPEADRAHREKHKHDDLDDYDELRSHRSGRTARTTKTAKTSKTSKSQKTSSKERDREASDRRSSKRATVESVRGDPTRKSSKKAKEKEKERSHDSKPKLIGDRRNNTDLAYRPKASRQGDNMLKALFKSKDRKELVMA